MSTWILIVIMSTRVGWSAPNAFSHEFYSEATCSAAATAVVKNSDASVITAICVMK